MPRRQADRNKLQQWLIIPDSHVPHEDKRAYDLMLWVASEAQEGRGVDGICILGDFADFEAVSSHEKLGREERYLQQEVAAVSARLRELEKMFPRAEKIFIQGNHEQRLERYIGKNCEELFGVMDTDSLLQLSRNGWKFTPFTPDQTLTRIGKSKLWARHEPLSGGQLPAHGSVIKAGCSIVHGHTHQAQSSQVVMANGDTHIGMCVGWLGDKKSHAFDYVKGHHQWSLGFGLATVDTDGTFFLETVRIINYRCLANGILWEG